MKALEAHFCLSKNKLNHLYLSNAAEMTMSVMSKQGKPSQFALVRYLRLCALFLKLYHLTDIVCEIKPQCARVYVQQLSLV